MRLPISLLAPVLALALAGCGAEWKAVDVDGDGFTASQGDCDEGARGTGAFPGAVETWYDGVDSDCDGRDDFDKDGDGFVSAAHGGEDCWDDDEDPAAPRTVVGAVALRAADVFPGAADGWYDGVDQDCGGEDDFDQDGDGFRSSVMPDVDGDLGDDCWDDVDDSRPDVTTCEADGSGEQLTPADVYPGATDAPLDGVDAGCDGDESGVEFDADGDTYAFCTECDDSNAAIYPNPAVPEEWYDGIDQNCDGNDGDQDGDGVLSTAVGGTDCWDDPNVIPAGFDAVGGAAQPGAGDVYPGAIEVWYDGVDANCAGDDDFDQDADGQRITARRDRDGTFGIDCDDASAGVYVGAAEVWYDDVDQDCDGNDDDQDGDGFASADHGGNDCNDTNNLINPGVAEQCDRLDTDEDCNGLSDNADTVTVATAGAFARYRDADADGFGVPTPTYFCDEPGSAYATLNTDCLDTGTGAASTFPGAAERESSTTACRSDVDGDGYGASSPVSGVSAGTDCVDSNVAIYPTATETAADGTDSDCNASEQCYRDVDGDSYRTNTLVSVTVTAGSTAVCSSGGYAPSTMSATDCVDGNAAINPGATETAADGTDSDCNASEQCYQDADGDSYRTTTLTAYSVTAGATGVCSTSGRALSSMSSADCVDGNAAINPGASETAADGTDSNCDASEQCYQDADGDTYRTATLSTYTVTRGGTGQCTGSGRAPSTMSATDCVDGTAGINPGASETAADGTDSNCDASEQCYQDADGDSYRTATLSSYTVTAGGTGQCTGSGKAPSAMSATDCLDTNANAFPGAAETQSSTTCMEDADADGYGDSSPPGGVTAGSDCNDGNAAISPGDPEVCDSANADEDCDGNADDFDSITSLTSGSVGRYTDADLDGYGTGTVAYYCDPATSGLSATAGDCNDGNAAISPGDPEVCDASNTDEDCDGTADDSDSGGATGKSTWYRDADSDTQGASATTSSACDQPSGYVSNANDCNDTSAYIYQGAPELCDGLNNGCSGGAAASGWSAGTSEDGVVSKVTSAGVWSNVSITGTSGAPTTLALDGSTYHVCDGTYYARMSVNTNATPTVQARSGSGSTFVISTGTAVGPTLTVDATTGRSGTRATLTGVTIEGGSAGTGTSGSDLGAGIYVATATGTAAPAATHLTMTNVTIRDGVAAYGGGLALVGMAGASGSGVTFRDNLAIERGGGVYATGTSTLTCTGCAFTDNMADNVSNPADTDADGAGICGDGNVTFTISTSTFSGNVADDNGGAGFLFNGAQLTLTGSTVELNEARTGGAFHMRQTLANTTTTSVASLATARASYLNLLSSDLALNIASDDGGAVYVDRSSVLGCTGTTGASYNHGFDSNEADRGGAIFVSQLDYTKLVFDTCDFTGNNATTASSGEDLAVLDGASLNYTADAFGLNYTDTCEKTGSNYQCN